ncbi:hypothetical protein KKA15_03945 [Patescibacteria group bacterium]|nr:hypothetical protein [Patescibacteria group bacterium]
MGIEKIIELIQKTGDRCVVVDKTGNPSYVILSFGAYERLLEGKNDVSSLTEEELLEKINRDVANWKLNQDEAKVEEFDNLEMAMKQESTNEETETEEKYYFEPVE